MSVSASSRISSGQWRFLAIIAIPTAIVVGSLTIYLFQEGPQQPSSLQPVRNADLPSDRTNPQDIILARLDSENKTLRQELSYIKNLIIDQKKNEESNLKKELELKEELAQLKIELKQTKQERISYDYPTAAGPFQEAGPHPMPPVIEKRAPLIEVVSLEKTNMVKNVNSSIPAGTTVRAVLVSSVDAPCGAFCSTDPQPVKLRILDDGHLPKCVRAKLKGGIVIASVYGDISTERVYARLERLTQVKPDGNYIETDVTGFITGEDGKYGIRGVVVDKSFKQIKNAAISGFFSGVGDFFQAFAASRNGFGPYNCAPGLPGFNCGPEGCAPNFFSGVATQGAAAGASSALDQLTDYYIRRADQIRPVIEVDAGRIVDITFTIGTDIGDLHTKERVEEIRISSRVNER